MDCDQLLARLQGLTGLKFASGRVFMWSPELHLVSYDARRLNHPRGQLLLLHEVAHALLGHDRDDGARLDGERAAWRLAVAMADGLGIRVDQDLIERRLLGERGTVNLSSHRNSDSTKA